MALKLTVNMADFTLDTNIQLFCTVLYKSSICHNDALMITAHEQLQDVFRVVLEPTFTSVLS
jgi:hypothetical protein